MLLRRGNMQRVRIDAEGTTTDCPLAGLGIGTREDCGDCIYFMEMDGFEVVCSCQEPIEEDDDNR